MNIDRQLELRQRPQQRCVMRQSWNDLLFLHWRLDPDLVQAALPAGLQVDTFDNAAWIGVVPFFMRHIRLSGLPSLPGATNFLELNLRTYVVDERGTPGVWFFSLDANSALSVWGARLWFGLPYWRAKMTAARDAQSGAIDFRCHRIGTPESTASRFVYAGEGPLTTAQPGSLEFFLVERYLLFSRSRLGVLRSGRVHHPPYEFASARVTLSDGHLLGLNGFEAPITPPDHAAFSPGVAVEIFGLRRN
ncbi:MAG: DUF2071 domain-containing protein [Planctomycetaceae bacterium]